MSNCKSVSTPIDHAAKFESAPKGTPPFEQNLYQQMIGALLYLVTCTRPDLAFVISFLSQFSSCPLESHHTAVKHVFRYISSTKSFTLKYSRLSNASASPFSLHGYSDADFANCLDTRRSFSGYCFMLGDAVISWRTQKQQSVAVSTTEAKYMALSLTSRQAVWYEHALKQISHSTNINLYCDNQSGINIAENAVHH